MESTIMRDIFNRTKFYTKSLFIFLLFLIYFLLCQFEFIVFVKSMFDRISKVVPPFDFPPRCSSIVGSCNGLLCFPTYANVIYLWNPILENSRDSLILA